MLIDNGVVALDGPAFIGRDPTAKGLGLGWNMSELDPLAGGFGTGEALDCDVFGLSGRTGEGEGLHIWSPSFSKGTN